MYLMFDVRNLSYYMTLVICVSDIPVLQAYNLSRITGRPSLRKFLLLHQLTFQDDGCLFQNGDCSGLVLSILQAKHLVLSIYQNLYTLKFKRK